MTDPAVVVLVEGRSTGGDRRLRSFCHPVCFCHPLSRTVD